MGLNSVVKPSEIMTGGLYLLTIQYLVKELPCRFECTHMHRPTSIHVTYFVHSFLLAFSLLWVMFVCLSLQMWSVENMKRICYHIFACITFFFLSSFRSIKGIIPSGLESYVYIHGYKHHKHSAITCGPAWVKIKLDLDHKFDSFCL